MLCSAHLAAIAYVRKLDAALRRRIGATVGRANALISEPILTILPRPRGIIRLAASRPTKKALERLVSITRRHSSAWKLDQRLSHLDAGIVDKDIDFDTRRIKTLKGGDDGCLVGHVEGLGEDDMALRPHGVGGFRQAIGIHAVQHQPGPGLGTSGGTACPRPREEPVTRAALPSRLNSGSCNSFHSRSWFALSLPAGHRGRAGRAVRL